MRFEQKRLLLVMALSVIPGASQLYLGLTKKAAGLFVIDAMIVLTLVFSGSYILRFLTVGIYFITFLPAALESYQLAKYGENRIDTDAKWYIIVLLLTTGFSALPLLWQSDSFSKSAKVAWTVTVPLLALIFFTVLARYWGYLESIIQSAVNNII